MSGDRNAHIADCDQDKLPPSTDYDGTLCCTVKELCYDGKDNDGDGLVDCADPECNGANHGGSLDPFDPNTNSPQVCHPAASCPQTVHKGLEGYWQFENATNDSTTNENDITANSASFTNHIRGKLGLALDFDTSDSATVPNDGSFYETLDPDQGLSVAAYVNPDTSSQTGSIIDKGSYELYLSGGDAYFDVSTTSGSTNINIGSVPAGEWTHLAATYNASTGDAEGYLDGSSTATGSTSGDVSDSATDVTIGDGTAGGYDGRIDEARIYSRELTSTEASSFTNYKCQNRQRTIECINNPELCETNYANASTDRYHCNFGQFDDPTNTNYGDASVEGTGVCCPKDERATYDSFTDEWSCVDTDTCGVSGSKPCEYDITSNESAWFESKSDGTNFACNSQVNDLNEDLTETTNPEGSQACCYVPKKGKLDYWYKDGNVKIYG
ncbi:LamG-like jellyroll fold domain-containing protein [Salinibacter sp.]|uniref:LamG-like jellyroll fold domain-containing protein n=1 Tax=Salinibacter sp. TaxID=2065818 RepID=UPI0021E75E9A|nr:LamG domain-containing protein [Salinibacter sp.]